MSLIGEVLDFIANILRSHNLKIVVAMKRTVGVFMYQFFLIGSYLQLKFVMCQFSMILVETMLG